MASATDPAAGAHGDSAASSVLDPPRGLWGQTWDGALDLWLRFRTGTHADTAHCRYVLADPATATATTATPTTPAGGKRKKKAGLALGQVLRRDALPPKAEGSVRLVVVSDTHGQHEPLGILPEGDIFVHCGDLLMASRLWTPRGRVAKYRALNEWLGSGAVRCPTRLVVAGNHDQTLEDLGREAAAALLSNATYLENEGMVWSSPSTGPVTIFGTPRSSGHSRNAAFQGRPFATATAAAAAVVGGEAAAASSPVVLVTHGPSTKLRSAFGGALRAHLWGHAHPAYGAKWEASVLSVCAAVMDASYRPAQLPFVLDLPIRSAAATAVRSAEL